MHTVAEVQVEHEIGQAEHSEALFLYFPLLQSKHIDISAESHWEHPLKHYVQFSVPDNLTYPTSHLLSSHVFNLEQERQLLAHVMHNPLTGR